MIDASHVSAELADTANPVVNNATAAAKYVKSATDGLHRSVSCG